MPGQRNPGTPKGRYANKWGELLNDLAEGSRMTNVEIAEKAGLSTPWLMHGWITGKTLPPLDDRLDALADALGLKGDERILFFNEASLAHSPQDIQESYRTMKVERAAMKKRIASLEAQLKLVTGKAPAAQAGGEPEVIEG